MSSVSAVTELAPARRLAWLEAREVWQYRELLGFLVWRDVKVRYKQTVIGAGWAVAQPFVTMVLFTVFFGVLARMPTGGLPPAVFYASALVPWTFFAAGLTQATGSIVDNQRLVTRVYFPRVILPMAGVLTGFVDLAIATAVLFGLTLAHGVAPSPAVVLLPVFVALLALTALAAGLWLSALNALYRDVRYALPFCVQVWMFASPVAYPTSLVPAEWRWLIALNPVTGAIDGFRWAVAGGTAPSPALLAVSTAVVGVLLAGGLAYFRHVESLMADVV
jgi:lipopolysaccharide transport system permease protein